MLRLSFSLAVACALASPVSAQLDGFEQPPINYKTAPAENVVTALQKRIDAGRAKLKFTEDLGYLPAILKELNVPPSSQILVFSKTSFQRERSIRHSDFWPRGRTRPPWSSRRAGSRCFLSCS